MRFLIDESTGASVADFLRSQGHDVVEIAEAKPRAVDEDILVDALADRRILITNDKDFGDLVFGSGMGHDGVLLLRLRDESAANRVAVVARVVQHHAASLPGKFVVATDSHVRIRK